MLTDDLTKSETYRLIKLHTTFITMNMTSPHAQYVAKKSWAGIVDLYKGEFFIGSCHFRRLCEVQSHRNYMEIIF